VSSPPPSDVGAGVGLQPSLPFGSQGVGQGVSIISWDFGDGLSVGTGVGFGVSSMICDGFREGAGVGSRVSGSPTGFGDGLSVFSASERASGARSAAGSAIWSLWSAPASACNPEAVKSGTTQAK